MRKTCFTKQVGVLFTDASYDKLIRITDAQQMTLSKFIRQLVEARLDQYNDQGEPDPNGFHFRL